LTDPTSRPPRERYALIGTGHRAHMYLDALRGDHSDVGELVAWSDSNPGRLDFYEAEFAAAGEVAPKRFTPDELERTIADERIDRVIVTSPDFTHAEYVSRSLLAGADVVVEKPITINAEGLRRIAAAIEESGHSVVTTFNYRYSPRNSALRELIQRGDIGDVTSVHFEWVLDTVHGADYFRRWHRYKDRSGGLLIHKASHHFDLVNWWIAAAPTRVYASGGLRFYGADNARARGLGERPSRGLGVTDDPFALDLTNDARQKALYIDNEHHDGYLRDRDVFDEGITIEDNLALVVDYDSGATMSYSLNAHSPWEGYRVMVNGTKGRAELEVIERGAVLIGEDGSVVIDPSAAPADFAGSNLRPEGIGSHGGGDAYLLDHVFNRVTEDPLGRPAGYADGVRAVSVGIAGNLSLETGLPTIVADLGL
jgi:predicted dehydrogenase